MREKRRKIPLEVILATPVSEARRKHGQQVYASRLCVKADRLSKAGEHGVSARVYEEAKAYCVKNQLPWPPFTGVPISKEVITTEPATGLPDIPVIPSNPASPEACALDHAATVDVEFPATRPSDGAREAGPVVREEATPQELANTGDIAPSDPFAGAAHGAEREAQTSVRCYALHETGAPASPLLRKAKVWARCPNKRLLKIKFMDGNGEFASMWNYRSGYRINDILEVEMDKGSGASCIWQERRKRV